MRYHLKEERYICPLIILWLCNNYRINYYAISCKILMCALFHVYLNGNTFYNFLINTTWPPKPGLRFFLWWFNLSKSHIMCIQPDFIRFHQIKLCVEFVLLILSEIGETVVQIIGLRTTYTNTKPLGVLISFKIDILCQKL